MGLKAAVQALKRAEPLKDKVQRCKDLLNDNDAWVCQQQLQKIYQQVLILDLEYALDRKVEQELWNLGFKNYIATLQSQAKDRKNPKRGESQALLSWCLEAASGFYLTLLQEICTVFDLDLPFRRKGYVYGCTSPWKAVEKLSTPHKSSCLYACQYCLVHLGDIARYRNENRQAELFYRHAVSLSPSSGQPYNQLALLEASRGDKLGTVFHYARSVTVKHPFPVALTNLAKTLSSALNDKSFNIDGKTKLNSQEYIAIFLKLHGIIHNFGDLKLACSYSKLLAETLTALVATESFSSWMLVQMLVINLYALQNTVGISADSTELLKSEQLSNDETLARDCILDLIAGTLSALLLPVYTMKNSFIEYFALPSIKLCLDWIRIKPIVLEETAFTSRLQIWPSLCVLLNALQNCVVDFKYDNFVLVPLPEDRDLQGFLPLEKSFENLRFSNTDLEGDIETLNKLRAVRILHLGRCLARYQINGSAPISITTEVKTGDSKFTPISNGTGPSNELMKELEELSMNKENESTAKSPVSSEDSSSKDSTDIDVEIVVDENNTSQGILKPEGSLERNRDYSEITAEKNDIEAKLQSKKPRKNVAMQAIMRRAETEQKQVTFKNVSPTITEEENDKETNEAAIVSLNNTSVEDMPSFADLSNVLNSSPTVPAANPVNSGSIRRKLPKTSVTTSPQIIQRSMKEQQIRLPQMHPNVTPCKQPAAPYRPCYPSSVPFNLPNPQFMNFLPNQRFPTYPIQGHLSNSAPAIMQNAGMPHAINPNRSLHQRKPPNRSNPSLQQLVRMTVATHAESERPPKILQPISINLQSNTNMEQHNCVVGIQQSQMQSNVIQRPSTLPVQLNLPGSNLPNIPLPLPMYNKSSQLIANLPNIQQTPSSPKTACSQHRISNQKNFNDDPTKRLALSHCRLLPPSYYYEEVYEPLELSLPDQTSIFNDQSQQQSPPMPENYLGYNYENRESFNVWKNDNRSPQVSWLDSLQMEDWKNPSIFDNSQSSWTESPHLKNVTEKLSLTPGKNYKQQQDTIHDKSTSDTGDSKPFESVILQEPSRSVNPGNTYSLFSNTWNTATLPIPGSTNEDQTNVPHQQSLWSGPGPSPLERLLEQQKSQRDGGTT